MIGLAGQGTAPPRSQALPGTALSWRLRLLFFACARGRASRAVRSQAEPGTAEISRERLTHGSSSSFSGAAGGAKGEAGAPYLRTRSRYDTPRSIQAGFAVPLR